MRLWLARLIAGKRYVISERLPLKVVWSSTSGTSNLTLYSWTTTSDGAWTDS